VTSTDAALLLGLKLPTTRNALKAAFHRKAREEHPDQSQAADAHERYLRVQEAYECLQRASNEIIEVEHEGARDLVCDDGMTKVADLGKGLPHNVNGKPCPQCDGRGFQSYSLEHEHDCPDCSQVMTSLFEAISLGGYGYSKWKYRCTKCQGSGLFRLRNGAVKGRCFKCKGTGWSLPQAGRNHCATCKGTGRDPARKHHMGYTLCLECKGCGEVIIFNPVLPKGLLKLGRL
jgi:DnaJ-class molecular chaperone